MPTQRTARVKLNRRAVDAIELAAGDGAFAVAKAVVSTAHPPDAPIAGLGLVQGGGALAWVGRKKVAGTSIGGRQIAKPRALKLDDSSIVAIGGFGFPARFVEQGTVHSRPNPFLTRAMIAVQGKAAGIFRQAASYRIARIRGR